MSEARRSSALWQVANELRDDGRISPAVLLHAAVQRGVRPTVDEFAEVAVPLFGRAAGGFFSPAPYIEFVRLYAAALGARSLLEPWAGTGLLLIDLAERLVLDQAVGVIAWQEMCEAAREVGEAAGTSTTFIQGDPRHTELAQLGSFDLLLGSPPWGMRASKKTVALDGGGEVELRDEEGYLALIELFSLLSRAGEALLLVPDGFFRDRPNSVWRSLPSLGAFPKAVVSLARGATPGMAIAANIVVLDHVERDEMFVGQVSAATDAAAIVENLIAWRSGDVVELGGFTDPARFRSWLSYVSEQQLLSYGDKLGVRPRRLGEICREINSHDPQTDFEEKPNSVYLKLIGDLAAPATTRFEDFPFKPKTQRAEPPRREIVQLVLDEDEALAEYVALYLNSEIGQTLRRQLLAGVAIPRLNRRDLPEMLVYLPALEVQAEAARLRTAVRSLRARLDSIERRQWEDPLDTEALAAEVEALEPRQDPEAWVEELPFPLASILRRYHADADERLKVEHLLHFFEALAEFICAVMLGAFRSQPDLFEQRRAEWLRGTRLRTPTFGTWTTIGGRLAVTVREMLDSGEQRQVVLDAFGTRRAALPQNLADAALHGSLHRALGVRNDERHGGLSGARELRRRLVDLESELELVRPLLRDAFRGAPLVSLMSTQPQADGSFENRIRMLVGSNTIFREQTVTTRSVLFTGKLYLLDAQTLVPLDLLPLVRIMASPSTEANACYFYNRIEGDNGGQRARLVSYHFEQEPDVPAADPEIVAMIGELTT